MKDLSHAARSLVHPFKMQGTSTCLQHRHITTRLFIVCLSPCQQRSRETDTISLHIKQHHSHPFTMPSSSFTFVSKSLALNRPETGTFARQAQPASPANSSQNPALIGARNKLFAWLPWDADRPLHEVTESSGQLSSTSRGTPRSFHDASADPAKAREAKENRKKRHEQRRKKASKSGGGLKYGNHAIRALRWGQVKRMWPALLDKLWEIDDDEEAAWGVWGTLKKKLQRVGKALGLILRGGPYIPDTRAGVQNDEAGEGW